MSDYKNIDDLIALTETILSEVPGVSVQTYSEDKIAKNLIEGYYFVSRKRWWTSQCQWFTNLALDGTTGIPTTDLTGVIKFGDIRGIWPTDRIRPLPLLPMTTNPTLIPTGRALYVEEYHGSPDRLFRIWPLTATTALNAHARVLLTESQIMDSGNLINFNPYVLANYAAFSMAAADGANSGETALLQQKYTDMLKQEGEILDNQPIVMDTARPLDMIDMWTAGPVT